MDQIERRKYPRHDTEIRVTVHKDGEKIPATMIDISKGGIGLTTSRGFFPGNEVDITLNSFDDNAVHGTVKWAQLTSINEKAQYRIGISADRVLVVKDILEGGSS